MKPRAHKSNVKQMDGPEINERGQELVSDDIFEASVHPELILDL